MANRSCYERAAIFLKTGLINWRTLENEAIVQRRSATLKACDAVALQWLSVRFQIRRTFASRFAIVCGQFYCARHEKWQRFSVRKEEFTFQNRRPVSLAKLIPVKCR